MKCSVCKDWGVVKVPVFDVWKECKDCEEVK